MKSEQQLRIKSQAKPVLRTLKSMSQRGACGDSQPFSYQNLRAKQKAFERYKKIYPIDDKQNLYPLSKTPHMGYYVLKGYRQDLNNQKEVDASGQSQHLKSSDRIISNMLKKYLCRKQQAQVKQNESLPKLDHSALMPSQTNRCLLYLGPRKATRVVTEYGDRGISSEMG